jgi:hypothetical protein
LHNFRYRASFSQVWLLRTHKDTRLPDFVVQAIRAKKVVKAVLGLQQVKINQGMQKTFECAPKGIPGF